MADIVQLLLYLGMMNTILFTPSPLAVNAEIRTANNGKIRFENLAINSRKDPYHTTDSFNILTSPCPQNFINTFFPHDLGIP